MADDEAKIARKIGKIGGVLPVDAGVGIKYGFSEIKKGDMPKGEEAAYTKLRNLRAEARYVGAREKRAKAKEEAEEAKKK
jgi:large subunit ribosomal protein L13e